MTQRFFTHLPAAFSHQIWLMGLMLFGLVSIPGQLFAAEIEAQWSQWRGPDRTGFTQADSWPARLDEASLTRQWSVPLDDSYSGPIVCGSRVITTETVDERFEQVTALDRATGEILWQQRWEGAMRVPFFAASRGSWIRSTPVCDGKTVYVGGIRDYLVALDVETGAIKWTKDLVAEFSAALPAFGFASSPLVDGGFVYAQAGGGVVKVDGETGDIVWRGMVDGGGMSGSAFSSPVIVTLGGERQLLVQGREQLAGVSLTSGETLWTEEVPAYRGMNILTPTLWGQRIFTSTYRGRSFLYEVNRAGDQFTVKTVWENKLQGYMSSPIIIGDYVYVHLSNRRFACIDLRSGKEQWITTPFGQYWSLIAQGDRMLALDETGDLLLIRANPEQFELIDRRKVSEDSAWAHLANDQDQLFVRGLNHLTAFRWGQP